MINVKVYISVTGGGGRREDGGREREMRRRRRTMEGRGERGGNATHSIKWPEKTTERGEGKQEK